MRSLSSLETGERVLIRSVSSPRLDGLLPILRGTSPLRYRLAHSPEPHLRVANSKLCSFSEVELLKKEAVKDAKDAKDAQDTDKRKSLLIGGTQTPSTGVGAENRWNSYPNHWD